jgi:hypothetical protein
MATGRPRTGQLPTKKPNTKSKKTPKKKIKPKRVRQKKETLTLHHPDSPLQIDHSAYIDKEAEQAERSAVHDKWWLAAFLVHTLGYLGTSAFINYAAITNDKLPITEGTLGPIDTYVLH